MAINKKKLVRNLLGSSQYKNALKSLFFRHTALTYDDLVAEFHHGIAKGLIVVTSYGDPVCYLVARGMWQVRSSVRQALKKTSQQVCVCGDVRTFAYDKPCKKCGEAGKHDTRVRFDEIDEEHDLPTYDADAILLKVMVERSIPRGGLAEKVATKLMEGTTAEELPAVLGVSKQRISQVILKLKEYLT